jgi:hypothetical protein
VVCGGYMNIAGDNITDTSSTVGGGWLNRAYGKYSTIGGGSNNRASGAFSSVLGGFNNVANGANSAIPGGSFLIVGDRSFGFRGGIDGNPFYPIDVSSENETFHIVDARFHFNYRNVDSDFRIDGTLDNALFVDASENKVGIGTASPNYQLDVVGDLGVTTDAYKGGTGSWLTYSDRKLKTDITPFKDGLDELLNIHPVYYFYNEGNPFGLPSNRQYIGVIAQDLQQVMPEAVSELPNGYLAVNNDPILWSIVNAMKQLKAENDRKQAEIDNLQEQLNLLKQRLDSLENK